MAKTYFDALENMGKGGSGVLNNKEEKRSFSKSESVEKRQLKSDESSLAAEDVKDKFFGYYKVVKLKPYEVLSRDYLRLRDGREFYSGMSWYNSRIAFFDTRLQVCVLDDGFFFPISWFLEDF